MPKKNVAHILTIIESIQPIYGMSVRRNCIKSTITAIVTISTAARWLIFACPPPPDDCGIFGPVGPARGLRGIFGPVGFIVQVQSQPHCRHLLVALQPGWRLFPESLAGAPAQD